MEVLQQLIKSLHCSPIIKGYFKFQIQYGADGFISGFTYAHLGTKVPYCEAGQGSIVAP